MLCQHKISHKCLKCGSNGAKAKRHSVIVIRSTRSHWFTVLSTTARMVENFCPDFPGYCLKCVKFGWLIVREITKIRVTRCQILRL